MTVYMVQEETFGHFSKPEGFYVNPWMALGVALNCRQIREYPNPHQLFAQVYWEEDGLQIPATIRPGSMEIMAAHLDNGFTIGIEAYEESTFYTKMSIMPIPVERTLQAGSTIYVAARVDYDTYFTYLGCYTSGQEARKRLESEGLTYQGRGDWDDDVEDGGYGVVRQHVIR